MQPLTFNPLSIPGRAEVIRQFKEQGGGIAAVLPVHSPRALLRAFGLLPVEVWGPPQVDSSAGAAHLQPYVCSIAQNALSFLLLGGLETTDVLLVPHTCDSLQGLGSLLIDFIRPRQLVMTLYLPRGERESDRLFLSEELRCLYGKLAEATGNSPSDGELLACIRQEEAADALLMALHEQRAQLPMTSLDYYRLLRAREYLSAEAFADLARLALAQGGGPALAHGIPILLSGIVPEPMALLDEIEKLGGWVAADDLACCGRRLFPPGKSADPFLRMAESLLGAAPDAMRGSPLQSRLDHLLRLAGESGAKGVVFYTVKFCEPELFDLPLLRQGLQASGLRCLLLEADLNAPLAHQTLTRLEAFLETLA